MEVAVEDMAGIVQGTNIMIREPQCTYASITIFTYWRLGGTIRDSPSFLGVRQETACKALRPILRRCLVRYCYLPRAIDQAHIQPVEHTKTSLVPGPFFTADLSDHQGRAVIEVLLAKCPTTVIHALVRHPSAPMAQAFRGVKSFKGDYDNIAALDAAMAGGSGSG
jgi:hypothetical protein